MPTEDRLITFSYEELYLAVTALCEQQGMKQPAVGTLDAVEYPDGDTSRILLKITDDEGHTYSDEEYSRDFFAAALMMYCRDEKIPLPKTAKKSVIIHNKDVSLRVRLG